MKAKTFNQAKRTEKMESSAFMQQPWTQGPTAELVQSFNNRRQKKRSKKGRL